MTRWLRKSFGVVLVAMLAQGARAQTAESGTAPFILDGNRVYAEVEFLRQDGSARNTLLFIDMGSPAMILSQELLQEVRGGADKAITFRIGKMTVDVEARSVTADSWLPFPIDGKRRVEGILPAGVMQNYQARFDYAHRTMTLAKRGTLRPEGTAVPFRTNQKTGLIAVEATIDGAIYPITIDNGSGYTWLRKSAAQAWIARHAEWQRGSGAVGASNMRMADDGIEAAGTLLRIPEIKLGSLRVEGVGALAIGADNSGHDFMDWYSTKNATPVIGWLGGNVLRAFRITIDYPNHISYWLRQSESDAHDLDSIGLSLIFKHGDYFVSAIVAQNGKPTVTGIETGDKLVQIGELRTSGASRRAVFTAMGGKAGAQRTVIVERGGKQIRVDARVTQF